MSVSESKLEELSIVQGYDLPPTLDETVREIRRTTCTPDELAQSIPKAAWYHTRQGVEWLHKSMPLPPEELRVYRRGQVFLVKGSSRPFMLVTTDGVGGIRACFVGLLSGNRYNGRTIPTQPQFTHGDISYLFNGRRFELVADSAEEYFKEKFNAENN